MVIVTHALLLPLFMVTHGRQKWMRSAVFVISAFVLIRWDDWRSGYIIGFLRLLPTGFVVSHGLPALCDSFWAG